MHQFQVTAATRLSADKAFEQLYKSSFKGLCTYAYTIVKDEANAEEIVQQVFFTIWDKKNRFDFDLPLTAYLYRAVHNASLNHLKHQKVRTGAEPEIASQWKQAAEPADKKTIHKELEQRLSTALNELPAQCRIIFQLSRFEYLKYHEIARELGLSAKTVENQMGKALRLMRSKLADLLPLLLFILLNP
ncbi:MAG TPA: RNA polymerase sigma-70 factor [Chitinophagaceae bacterium]|nr:RNA polymerase sigma-70 factor [Chitinophagaceae bacterium]